MKAFIIQKSVLQDPRNNPTSRWDTAFARSLAVLGSGKVGEEILDMARDLIPTKEWVRLVRETAEQDQDLQDPMTLVAILGSRLMGPAFNPAQASPDVQDGLLALGEAFADHVAKHLRAVARDARRKARELDRLFVPKPGKGGDDGE
jgi:hypothetical protein